MFIVEHSSIAHSSMATCCCILAWLRSSGGGPALRPASPGATITRSSQAPAACSRSPTTGAGAPGSTAQAARRLEPIADRQPPPRQQGGGGPERQGWKWERGSWRRARPPCVLMVIQPSGWVVGGAARALLLAQAVTLSLSAEIIWEISNPGGGCGSHSGSISALSPGSTQEGGTFPCGAPKNQTYGILCSLTASNHLVSHMQRQHKKYNESQGPSATAATNWCSSGRATGSPGTVFMWKCCFADPPMSVGHLFFSADGPDPACTTGTLNVEHGGTCCCPSSCKICGGGGCSGGCCTGNNCAGFASRSCDKVGPPCKRSSWCAGNGCSQLAGGHKTCHSSKPRGTCVCTAGWRGDNCEQPTGCDGAPCKNGATCTANAGAHTCACAAGWSGDSCNRATGCDSNPCKNGGTCTATGGSHSCKCIGEWGGDQDCSQPPCQNHDDCGAHGKCVDNGDTHTCNCTQGYVPAAPGGCNLAPCNGNGTGVNGTAPLPPGQSDGPGDCIFQLPSGQSCTPDCDGGVSPTGSYLVGKHRCENGTLYKAKCQLCTEDKCAHGGTCVSNEAADDYTCDCTDGWSGLQCSISDPCIIDRPCRNGGQCRDVSGNTAGYVCDCPPGYAGLNCERFITIWHTVCCLNNLSLCPLVWNNETVLSLRDAPQTGYLCTAFSAGRLTGSVLTSGLVVCVSIWTYARLLSTEARHIHLYVSIALCVSSCICGLALPVLIYEDRQGRVSLTSSGAEFGLLLLAVPVQFAIAVLWYTQRRCCRKATNSVSNRLWRGAAIPVLAAIASCPVVSVAIMYHRHTAALPAVRDIISDVGDGVIWRSVWLLMSAGVVVLMVPLAAAVGRLYLPYRVPSHKLLEDNGVHRAEVFSWAHKGYARLSGLLFVMPWIPYMANELAVFCNGIGNYSDGRGSAELVSLGVSAAGIRALSPVVVVLNACAVMGFGLAVASFPAPPSFSLFVFVGMGWGALVMLFLLAVTLALVWAMSERAAEAVRRHTQARETMRINMLRTSFMRMLEDNRPSRLRRIFMSVTSWQGQTAFSTVNHLAAIGMFCYGINKFSAEMHGSNIHSWLIAGVIMSCAGLVVSLGSLIERKWPQLKLTPTDDSFRLACLLKVALVMTKAMVVFLLAGIHGKSVAFQRWEDVVSIICFVSLAILALMTAAFAVRRVWGQPELLEQAGVHNPRAFIVLYAVSYICCKFATILFMAQGHMPGWMGCKQEKVTFTASKQYGLSPHSEAVKCTLCYPVVANSSMLVEGCKTTTKLYYACSTSCIDLFYSGDPSGLSLVWFVLIPLMWLPFAVYANNESAQLIDGTWWQHEASVAATASSVKIGLSSTADGYYTVAPLVQSVTLACGVILIWFVASTGGGYQIRVPHEMLDGLGERGTAIQAALFLAGRSVTVSAVVLNVTMMSRAAFEIIVAHAYRATANGIHKLGGSIAGQEMTEPLCEVVPSSKTRPEPVY
jgi:hypothetical protein